MSPLIFLIAGEASGDQLGADLMASLKERRPNVRFMGIGGEAMAAQGLRSLFPMQELSLMGLFGILRKLRSLRRRLKETVETIYQVKPDVVVTIDAPEFSFRVLKKLQQMPQKPRLIHYVAPTVWAWRPGRAQKISRLLDHLLCLYPFEPPYFEKVGLPATFVGHPVGKKACLSLPKDPHLLCLLPGSRSSEIETLLRIFRETVERVQKDVPELKVVIPTLISFRDLVLEETKTWPLEVKVVVGGDEREEAFARSTAALAASGTVTLQLSAAKLPFVVAYKMGRTTAFIARYLLQTPWVCMINILLVFQKMGPGFVLTPQVKKIIPTPWIPEFIQENCRADLLAPAVLTLLKDQQSRQTEIKAMEQAIASLKAPPGVAAETVLNIS